MKIRLCERHSFHVGTVLLWTLGEGNRKSSCGITCLFVFQPPCLFLANWVTEDSWILPAWVTAMQLKEGATKNDRPIFPCMGQGSCPEVTVPGIGGWTFTVGDKGTLLFFLPFVCFSCYLGVCVCCSPASLASPTASCFGLLPVLWQVTGHGWRWRLVASFTPSSICPCFSKVGLERTRQDLKATILNNWLTANDVKSLRLHKKGQKR